jgi:hypothetical protein
MQHTAQVVELERVHGAVLVLLPGSLPLAIVLVFYTIVDAIDPISQRIGHIIAVRIDLGSHAEKSCAPFGFFPGR